MKTLTFWDKSTQFWTKAYQYDVEKHPVFKAKIEIITTGACKNVHGKTKFQIFKHLWECNLKAWNLSVAYQTAVYLVAPVTDFLQPSWY